MVCDYHLPSVQDDHSTCTKLAELVSDSQGYVNACSYGNHIFQLFCWFSKLVDGYSCLSTCLWSQIYWQLGLCLLPSAACCFLCEYQWHEVLEWSVCLVVLCDTGPFHNSTGMRLFELQLLRGLVIWVQTQAAFGTDVLRLYPSGLAFSSLTKLHHAFVL